MLEGATGVTPKAGPPSRIDSPGDEIWPRAKPPLSSPGTDAREHIVDRSVAESFLQYQLLTCSTTTYIPRYIMSLVTHNQEVNQLIIYDLGVRIL